MGVCLEVGFYDKNGTLAAQYCSGGATDRLTFYVETLGQSWFAEGVTPDVAELLIHEFAHHTESNHLCERYHEACCRLGAQLTSLALAKPVFFAGFTVTQTQEGK